MIRYETLLVSVLLLGEIFIQGTEAKITPIRGGSSKPQAPSPNESDNNKASLSFLNPPSQYITYPQVPPSGHHPTQYPTGPQHPQYPTGPQYPSGPQKPHHPQYPTGPQNPHHPQYPTGPQHPYFPPPTNPYACAPCNCHCVIKPAPPKKCQWKTVFKALSGTGQSVLNAWDNGGSVNEGVPGADYITSQVPLRVASIIDNWNQLIIEQVKVEVFENGVRGSFLLFDGVASDKRSWFSQSRLISSPYRDLKENGNVPWFSIEGDNSLNRRFFVLQPYNGCDQDCGYLMVGDVGANAPCAWEQGMTFPIFIYGKMTATCSTFAQSSEVGYGDLFAISVKVCEE